MLFQFCKNKKLLMKIKELNIIKFILIVLNMNGCGKLKKSMNNISYR